MLQEVLIDSDCYNLHAHNFSPKKEGEMSSPIHLKDGYICFASGQDFFSGTPLTLVCNTCYFVCYLITTHISSFFYHITSNMDCGYLSRNPAYLQFCLSVQSKGS